MDTNIIVCYVFIGLITLFCIYLLVKELNTVKRITKLAEFVHGDVFSDRFHHVLSNYFMDENNVKYLIDPITPLIHNIIITNKTNETKATSPQNPQKDQTPDSNLISLGKDLHLFL